MDDVLDFTGEQAEVGKPVGSDLLQGLVTLPTLYYLEAHRDEPAVHTLINGRYLLERENMENLVQAIRESNATHLALEEAKASINQALLFLSSIPDGKERRALKDLALYIVNRRI